MRKFKFRLQAVLDHRERLAELKELEMARASSELAASDERIATMMRERETVIAAPRDFRNMAVIAQRESYVRGLEGRIAAETEKRRDIANRVEIARTALVAANQAKKAIQQVRDTGLQQHLRETMRVEQAVLDEFATIHSQIAKSGQGEHP